MNFNQNSLFYLTLIFVFGSYGYAIDPQKTKDTSPAPVADAGGPYVSSESMEIEFDASSSVDNNGKIVSYSWDFGDGNTSLESKARVKHTYLAPGTYVVKLVVTDDQGLSASGMSSVSIASNNSPPVADAGGPYEVFAGKAIRFDGSASTDDGTIIQYFWNFGDGQTANERSPKISHKYNKPGKYKVSLVVRDNRMTLSKAVQVAVEVMSTNLKPIADIGGPYSTTVGQKINFDVSKSIDNDGSIVEYLLEFGDGSSGVSSLSKITHVYDLPGSYTVSLMVRDNKNQLSVAANTIVTVESPLSSEFMAFSKGPYKVARRDCASCHSLSGTLSNLASPELKIAYEVSKRLSNFKSPAESIFVKRVMDSHCGVACETDGLEMTKAITEWAEVELKSEQSNGGLASR